jgi:DNA recombination protein RmuC
MTPNELIVALGTALALALGAIAFMAMRHRARLAEARESGRVEREGELATLAAERRAADERGVELAHRNTELERAVRQAQAGMAALREQRAALDVRIPQLESAEAERDRLATGMAEAHRQIAELKPRLETAQQQAEERRALLEHASERMTAEFQSMAQKILDEKSRHFVETNQAQLGSLLSPLREQLDGFRRAVSDAYDKEARERIGLRHELEQLKALNVRLGDEATTLTRALKGETRVQGAWGEMLLERLLEASGLERGREFVAQESFAGSEGGRQRPDVIVRLPDRRDILIDAKVSLVAYERYVAATDEGERARELAAHVASLREHVRGLSERRYSALEGVNSLDFVLMFVPIEAAFVEAVRADDLLYRFSIERNVSIVSASTLLATLRTVAGLWRSEDRNRNAMEIANRAGLLYDKFVGFVTDVDRLGVQLRRTQEAYDDARDKLSTGSGNLVRQTEELRKLGARTQKQLDRDLVDRASGGEGKVVQLPPPAPKD